MVKVKGKYKVCLCSATIAAYDASAALLSQTEPAYGPKPAVTLFGL